MESIYDNIPLESIASLVEGIKNEMTRKEILKKHKSPIKQLPSGKWYTRIDGRKIERKEKRDLEDIIIEQYLSEQITFISIFPSYLERRKLDVSDTTWQKDIFYYETYLKDSIIGNIPISSITLDDGYEFIKYCLGIYPEMKRKYWDNIRCFLNNIFQYAIDNHYVNDNPFRKLKPKKDLFAPPIKTRDEDAAFSKKEQYLVTELAKKDSQEQQKSEPLGILILFNLGLRDGELCALKWGDIERHISGVTYIHIQREMVANVTEDGKARGYRILPHCKSEAGDRRLPLNAAALETFQQIRKLNEANGIPTENDSYIFMRKYKGAILNCSSRSFDPRLRKYCRQAGMSVIKSPHDIRRTVITNLYMAHMPLKKIQEFAGHSSIQQTLDYLRITDDDLNMLQFVDTLSSTSDDNIISFRKEA